MSGDTGVMGQSGRPSSRTSPPVKAFSLSVSHFSVQVDCTPEELAEEVFASVHPAGGGRGSYCGGLWRRLIGENSKGDRHDGGGYSLAGNWANGPLRSVEGSIR